MEKPPLKELQQVPGINMDPGWMEQGGEQCIRRDESFHLFPQLPIELRYIIWESCWPESRIIEAANAEFNRNTNEYSGTTYLRLAGPLAVFLKTGFGGDRRLDCMKPLERCPAPISLQVCHESRKHTISQYHMIQHPESKIYSFFFNPSRDVLWLCRELTGEPECYQELER